MDYLKIANGFWLWLACGLGVAWVVFQSALFLVKSFRVSKEIGISKEQVNNAVKTSVVATLGPSLGILVGMVALLVSMGGPISWFRLSYIGSVAYEMFAAEVGAQAGGGALGTNMSGAAFATGLWVMTLGALGSILITALFTDKMGKLENVMAGGRKEILPIIAGCAMCGTFSYLCMDRVFRLDSQTVAALAGFAVMAVLNIYNKKVNRKWIRNWSFTIAMFAGMLISVIF